MPWRRLRVLIEHLPREGAFGRLFGWTDGEQLLAAAVELLDDLRRITMSVGGAKRHQLPPPLQIRRPGPKVPAEQPARRAATPEEAAALFAAALG